MHLQIKQNRQTIQCILFSGMQALCGKWKALARNKSLSNFATLRCSGRCSGRMWNSGDAEVEAGRYCRILKCSILKCRILKCLEHIQIGGMNAQQWPSLHCGQPQASRPELWPRSRAENLGPAVWACSALFIQEKNTKKS